MAIGDTLFIADKETLGVPNPTTANSDTAMNYLKKIDDKVMPWFDGYIPKTLHVSTTSATFVDVLNITGAGILVSVLNKPGNDFGFFEVFIDGVSTGSQLYHGSATTSAEHLLMFAFKSSLRITLKNNGGANAINGEIVYLLK